MSLARSSSVSIPVTSSARVAPLRREGGGDGVRERVGERPVDHVHAVQRRLPAQGARRVGLVARPGAGPADAATAPTAPSAIIPRIAGDGVRAERLEADLQARPLAAMPSAIRRNSA